MNNVNQYVVNEGYNMAWKGAVVGSTIGYNWASKFSFVNPNDPCHNNKFVPCAIDLAPVVGPAIGFVAGTFLGFTAGIFHGVHQLAYGSPVLQNDNIMTFDHRGEPKIDFQAVSISVGKHLLQGVVGITAATALSYLPVE